MIASPREFHSIMESGWPSTGRRTLSGSFHLPEAFPVPMPCPPSLVHSHAHTDLEPYRMAMESSGFFCVHAEPFMEDLASLQQS